MNERPIPSFTIVTLVMGTLCIAAACLPAAFVHRALTETHDYSTDATAAEIVSGGARDGEVVHLRSLRDRGAPLRLADGRVLYPVPEEPHVMVECGDDGCAGSLEGRVETLRLEGAPPPGWPVPAGDPVRVVRVGEVSEEAREHAMLAASMAGVLLLVGFLCIALSVLGLVRRARRRSSSLEM